MARARVTRLSSTKRRTTLTSPPPFWRGASSTGRAIPRGPSTAWPTSVQSPGTRWWRRRPRRDRTETESFGTSSECRICSYSTFFYATYRVTDWSTWSDTQYFLGIQQKPFVAWLRSENFLCFNQFHIITDWFQYQIGRLGLQRGYLLASKIKKSRFLDDLL